MYSHEQEFCPINSLDKNCKEFEFQTDGNHYVDLSESFLAVELKFVERSGCDTYENKEKKMELKDDAAVFTKTRTGNDEREEKVARVTM